MIREREVRKRYKMRVFCFGLLGISWSNRGDWHINDCWSIYRSIAKKGKLKSLYEMASLSRRYWCPIATFALVVVIVAIFPTPRTRTVEDLVETLDCNTTLEDGESLSAIWTNMQGHTKIVASILSSEDVQVLLTGKNGESDTFYSLSQKTHGFQHTREYPSYNVTVWNPTGSSYGCDVCDPIWSDDGSSAGMSGNIEAYHVYDIQEWLPWWMP